MPKDTTIVPVVDETISFMMEVADEYVEEISEQLEDIGNPEKLIGKPYEAWTQHDFMMLAQVYGNKPNKLSDLIFRKEYEKVKELEAEELE